MLTVYCNDVLTFSLLNVSLQSRQQNNQINHCMLKRYHNVNNKHEHTCYSKHYLIQNELILYKNIILPLTIYSLFFLIKIFHQQN